MATFSTKVADLVGSVSEDAALTFWLQDAAWDIIHRIKMVNPSMIHHFGTISENVGDSEAIGNNDVIAIYRTNSGTTREYREISPVQKYRALDSTSILYATTTDPVYYRENGGVNMLPLGGDNDLIAVGIDTTNLVYSGDPDNVLYFPDEMKHLIVLYASLQELQRKMADGTLTITAVPPDTPVSPDISSPGITTVTVGSLGEAPAYDKPSEPTYDTLQFEEFLETEEDTELAQAQLGRLNHEISQYQNNIQNELNEFNEKNTVYQSTVQKAIEDARMASQEAQKEGDMTFQATIQDYSLALQKYQGDIAVYSAEVQSQVQEYTVKNQSYQTQYTWIKQQYKEGFVPFQQPSKTVVTQ
jgi:phage gp36-like protein